MKSISEEHTKANERAILLSILSGDVWLVVDYSHSILNEDIRVWRESTIRQSHPVYPYEILSRAECGKIQIIA